MTVRKELTETQFVDHISSKSLHTLFLHKWRSFSTSRKNRERYSLRQKFIIVRFDVVKRTEAMLHDYTNNQFQAFR